MRSASSLSPLTPSTATPCVANSLCSLLKLGISRMQGTHQVAQKLTTTTLPDSAEISTGPPSSFVALGMPDDGVGAAAGAAAFTEVGAGGTGLFRNARDSEALLVEPGKVARSFSSGSRMAQKVI